MIKRIYQILKKWIDFLKSKGYSNYWQDLNAKDYGIAQNRNRCFMISILGNYEYSFPSPKKLDKIMMDYLEEDVEDKYYISHDKAEPLLTELSNERKLQNNTIIAGLNYKKIDKVGLDVAKTLLARDASGFSTGFCTQNAVIEYTHVKEKKLGNIYGFTGGNYAGNVYDINALSPTLNTMQGGNRQMVITDNHRIRKLTPKECWRLMGFDDDSFEKAAQVNSNTQLYKQAGNSIVVDVMVAMFKNLNIKQK